MMVKNMVSGNPKDFEPAVANETLVLQKYPSVGRELSATGVEELAIGRVFYMVKDANTPILSMMLGGTNNGLIKVAQGGAGRVTFAPASIGTKFRCFEACFKN